jgi:hypothetical protein
VCERERETVMCVRERESKRERETETSSVCACVYVCERNSFTHVFVCEKERESAWVCSNVCVHVCVCLCVIVCVCVCVCVCECECGILLGIRVLVFKPEKKLSRTVRSMCGFCITLSRETNRVHCKNSGLTACCFGIVIWPQIQVWIKVLVLDLTKKHLRRVMNMSRIMISGFDLIKQHLRRVMTMSGFCITLSMDYNCSSVPFDQNDCWHYFISLWNCINECQVEKTNVNFIEFWKLYK